MALGDKDVLPAIVVEIFEPYAPAGAGGREQAEACLQTAIAEQSVAIVVEERVDLTRQHGHQDIRATVVIVVLENRAHAGDGLAGVGEPRTSFQREFGKRAIAIVVEEKLAHPVIGHKYIGESVAIVIGKRDSE